MRAVVFAFSTLVATTLAVPSHAWAFALGTSYGFGQRNITNSPGRSPLAYPTLDLRADAFHLQFGALDLINGLVDERADIVARGYYGLAKQPATDALQGIFSVGGGVNLFTRGDYEDTSMIFEALARFGIENTGAYRLGVYITPGVGLAVMDGDLEMAFSGTLEASFAFPL